jgi:hypothetical protein
MKDIHLIFKTLIQFKVIDVSFIKRINEVEVPARFFLLSISLFLYE